MSRGYRGTCLWILMILGALHWSGCGGTPDRTPEEEGARALEDVEEIESDDASEEERIGEEEREDSWMEVGEAMRVIREAADDLRRGRHHSAREQLRSLEEHPDSEIRALTTFNLAVAAFYANQSDEAWSLMERAALIEPWSTPAIEVLVRQALWDDGADEARRVLRGLAAESDDEVAYQAVQLLVAAEDRPLSEIEAGVQQWLPRDEGNLLFHEALAAANLKAGRRELAEHISNEALRRDPSAAQFRVMLAEIAVERENPNRAIEELETALETASAPLQPEILNNLGVLYLRQLRNEEALELLERVTTQFPSYVEGWLNLASAYRADQQYAESWEALERVEQLREGMAERWLNKGILLMDAQELEEELGWERMERLHAARSAFQQYVERTSQSLSANHRVYAYLEEVETAIQVQELLDAN